MTDRALLSLTGADRVSFLQGLVTNDLARLAQGPVYCALLTPQGKYLADFFVIPEAEALLLDLPAALAAPVLQRLSLYKLRADVALALTERKVTRGTGTPPPGAWADPRHPVLGWRATNGAPGDTTDWAALRVAHVIPEHPTELTPDSYILEMGFERLHGVDFRKGCYVGQEVTARMKHKTELRRALVQVALDAAAEPGEPILSEGREAGILGTVSGARALATVTLSRLDLTPETCRAALEGGSPALRLTRRDGALAPA